MKDWRELVYAHLQAYRDDVYRRQESALWGAEAQFLSQYGTVSLKVAHDVAARARCDCLGKPPPKETYDVIEESPHRLLVEVRPPEATSSNEGRILFLATRFSLIEEATGWKIAAIYRPCLLCNRGAILTNKARTPVAQSEPGKCRYCWGSILGRKCTYCGGTGKCHQCMGEELPGWSQVFSLGGLRHGR
jgi:hypothetical protein